MNVKASLSYNKLKLLPLALFASFSAYAADINSVIYGKSADGAYEVQFLGKGFSNVSSFSLNQPPRIVIDIPNGRSHLAKTITKVNNPLISHVAVIEGDDRVRATLNLVKSVPYELIDSNNKITVAVKSPSKGRLSSAKEKSTKNKAVSRKRSADVSFTRSDNGKGGKVKIILPNNSTYVDVQRQGRKVVAKLRGGKFARAKRLDVRDFGTPVSSVDVFGNSLSVQAGTDQFEIVSYQKDKAYYIELNQPNRKVEEQQKNLLPGDSRKIYKGEKLSLNFQDIDVRAVLQLIADFTNINVVVSGDVQGSVTLRLNDVPWDQALDTILQSQGLGKRENGNVIFIAPNEKIKAAIEAAHGVTQAEEQLAPRQQEYIQIKYARAENIVKIIERDRKTGKEETSNLLSARGTLSVDSRTNSIIVNDVASSIDKIRALVAKLDVAVSQVLIDARIVSASSNFAHELGVKWGGFLPSIKDKNFGTIVSGSQSGTAKLYNSAASGERATLDTADRLGVNLGTTKTAYGSLGLMLLGKDFLLDMELSALQDNGRGEVISSPRVITQDGNRATIKSGKEIAYTTRDDSGTATVEFKEVNLQLDVTPKIAPNQMVDMILSVNKDTVGALTQTLDGVVPSIDTNQVQTQVLVDNGETVVLGGVYEQTKSRSIAKVPFFSRLPVVGNAFKRTTNSVQKSELLIFVTPKIIDQRYISRDKFSGLRN